MSSVGLESPSLKGYICPFVPSSKSKEGFDRKTLRRFLISIKVEEIPPEPSAPDEVADGKEEDIA